MAKKRGPKKKAGQGQAKETDLVLKGYEKFLGELKERIRSAQLKSSGLGQPRARPSLLADWRDILTR